MYVCMHVCIFVFKVYFLLLIHCYSFFLIGLRYIPFRTLTGVSLDQSGIFVLFSFDSAEENLPLRKTSKSSFIKPRGRLISY